MACWVSTNTIADANRRNYYHRAKLLRLTFVAPRYFYGFYPLKPAKNTSKVPEALPEKSATVDNPIGILLCLDANGREQGCLYCLELLKIVDQQRHLQ